MSAISGPLLQWLEDRLEQNKQRMHELQREKEELLEELAALEWRRPRLLSCWVRPPPVLLLFLLPPFSVLQPWLLEKAEATSAKWHFRAVRIPSSRPADTAEEEGNNFFLHGGLHFFLFLKLSRSDNMSTAAIVLTAFSSDWFLIYLRMHQFGWVFRDNAPHFFCLILAPVHVSWLPKKDFACLSLFEWNKVKWFNSFWMLSPCQLHSI